MKTLIQSAVHLAVLCALLAIHVSAQEIPLRSGGTTMGLAPDPSLANPNGKLMGEFKIAGKKATQYTPEEWGAWIDSAWGPGQGGAAQLQIFDSFWSMIDQQWAGFPNLNLNWDSLRTIYRPQIGSGLSRGRFYALMSRMWLALQDGMHSYISDLNVDGTFGTDNSTMWQYKRGFPLLNIGTGWWDLLGAPATALPDSTAVVYRAAPGNPLGLEPGDLLLGYEGVPWKNLYKQLLADGVPVNALWSVTAANPESQRQCLLSGVAANWGMFDTIDVVKYSTGDTVHLSTAPLANISQMIMASDQVPVAGVPMPHGALNNGPAVSWGVVQGTHVGYVYVWDWATAQTDQLWYNAIYDLLFNKKVEGLILDFRLNIGGDNPGKAGWALLFNIDPAQNFLIGTRTSTTDHMSFSYSARPSDWFTPVSLYDRPIAVLVGPNCMSTGDWNALRASFHPMARLFGKPTCGAFAGGVFTEGPLSDAWYYHFSANLTFLNVPGRGNMIHKGVQPDEEIWLTRDGVAKGDDDVVKRALGWITTLSYAHATQFSRRGIDTLGITAKVENPLSHSLRITATLTNGSGWFVDSLSLKDDGLHGDSILGDGLWGYSYIPVRDDTLRATIRTDDLTAGSSRTLPIVTSYQFTRKAVISVDTRTVDLGSVHDTPVDTSFYVKNVGFRADSLYVVLDDMHQTSLDPLISLFPAAISVAPGDSQKITVRVHPASISPGTYYFYVIINSRFGYAQTVFSKLLGLEKAPSEAIARGGELPAEFALAQNYPNPFNPSTAIRYALPQRANVTLTVYNTLGQLEATLVRGEEQAGYHEVKFDGSNLASGVYFYRLRAGTFVRTMKCLFVR